MDGTGGDYAKSNKKQRNRDGRDGNLKGEKLEMEMNHERLWTLGNKLKVSEGRGLGGWGCRVMSTKEGTFVMSTVCYIQLMNH